MTAAVGDPADCTSVDVTRFGLAVSKETPRILDENKVNRFFCSTVFSYPEDYQKRVIFGDYPYRFNISLTAVGEDAPRSVGDVVPGNYPYGYIRRDVKIKGSSNATIGKPMITKHGYNNTENVTLNQFRIVINSSYLLTQVGESKRDAAYRINPNGDRIIINITDLDETRNTVAHPPSEPYNVNLKRSKILPDTYRGYRTSMPFHRLRFENYLYVNWSIRSQKPPVDPGPDRNLSMIFEPGFFQYADKYGAIYINLTFELDPPQQFLNNTHTRPFDYNYNPGKCHTTRLDRCSHGGGSVVNTDGANCIPSRA